MNLDEDKTEKKPITLTEIKEKMIWSEWKAPKSKSRVWATCPKTNWLMLVDVDLVNSVSF